ncbi:MAG: hypothetical protein J6L69_03500 [Lachnospiraceae bacterium]|nr:hypothetical protein [Lachnospiraceae bacterium]
MNKDDWKKIKKILAWILIGIELVAGFVSFFIYVDLEEGHPHKRIYYWLTLIFLFAAIITIYINDYGNQVISAVKKVASVLYNLTIGFVSRVFDILFNMATGNRESRLKKISGYEDTVYSVDRKRKKRKAEYKKYKDMNNSEKVQFLYYKSVTKAIKKGFYFKESDTAFEVNERMLDRKYLKNSGFELGEIYSVGKYAADGRVTDEMVEKMKEIG